MAISIYCDLRQTACCEHGWSHCAHSFRWSGRKVNVSTDSHLVHFFHGGIRATRRQWYAAESTKAECDPSGKARMSSAHVKHMSNTDLPPDLSQLDTLCIALNQETLAKLSRAFSSPRPQNNADPDEEVQQAAGAPLTASTRSPTLIRPSRAA